MLIAVGDSGLILRTSNAGENWSVIQFQAGVIYEDVDFVNSTTGYVVGSGEGYSRPPMRERTGFSKRARQTLISFVLISSTRTSER
ncbi:MAG: hypothetical protein IPG02_12325 [Ignavibacteria bacterium]|nr:hypothetical protein [Ignavibacteria bacterium]